MKKIIFLLLINFYSSLSFAQKFHAFLFCKTSDELIGTSVRINYMNMREELQTIAIALNYQYVEHPITGSQFNIKNVTSSIQNSEIGNDDIVILYFSTHGAKSIYDSNIFPQIDIPDSLISAFKEHKLLLKKHPKFLMTVIEACSGYEDITPQEAFVYEQSSGVQYVESQLQIENIKKLFSSSCEIIITAGNPGKNTWATSQGSMFTNCFLRAMSESFDFLNSADVNWDNVLNQAKRYTYDMTSTTSIQYYPVWEKNDCNSLISQGIIDTSVVEKRNVSLNIITTKSHRLKNPYNVSLTIENNSGVKIDSVVYFLDKTMENPIWPVYDEKNKFYLSLAVWGTFPIKAKVYFADKKVFDLYKNFEFSK